MTKQSFEEYLPELDKTDRLEKKMLKELYARVKGLEAAVRSLEATGELAALDELKAKLAASTPGKPRKKS